MKVKLINISGYVWEFPNEDAADANLTKNWREVCLKAANELIVDERSGQCAICNRKIHYDGAWRHDDGNGTYWMKCSCGWEGSGVIQCPQCGNKCLADNHCCRVMFECKE